jgi:hypothetical protein
MRSKIGIALALCVTVATALVAQVAAPPTIKPDDSAAFKEFSKRVQTYMTLRKTVESGMPALKPTDLPEMISAYQQALARKIREARPHAEVGDVFTSDVREAFRHVSAAPLVGPHAATRKDMERDAPSPQMRLLVNGTYPDSEPNTPLSPALLKAFPPLPDELAYRVVGRTLILLDVKSRLIVDFARLILPPA